MKKLLLVALISSSASSFSDDKESSALKENSKNNHFETSIGEIPLQDQYVDEKRSFRYSFQPNFIDPDGYPSANEIKEEIRQNKDYYRGQDGYIQFSEKFFSGKMKDCFKYVFIALTKSEFLELGWKSSTRQAEDLKFEIYRILDGKNVKAEFKNKAGFFKYASYYYPDNPGRAYFAVLDILNESQKKELNWGEYFPGTLSQLKEIRTTLIDPYGYINFEYKNQSGLIRYVKMYGINDIDLIYRSLDSEERRQLNWQITSSSGETSYETRIIRKLKSLQKLELFAPKNTVRKSARK